MFALAKRLLTFGRSHQSAQMSEIKNDGLDQYGVGPFEQQQFGTAGVEGANSSCCDTASMR